MKKGRRTLFSVLTAVLASTSFAHAGVFPYAVERSVLDNGLTLYVVPMNTPGVVAYGTWMSVGSGDEVDEGRTGFAHFFEHLMFLGTPTRRAADRERALLRMAADDNAWTWLDETVYNTVLPAASLEELVAMEGDRFQNLTLTADDVRREAGAVYGEFRKSAANPGFRVDEAMWDAAFTTHPYRHSTIGYEADIADMPSAWEYASEFMQRHYRPEKATVLAVGDVDPAQVRKWVEAAYGGWSVPDVETPVVPEEPAQEGARRVHVDWEGSTSPRMKMGWKIPASDGDTPPTAELELLEGLLLSDTGPLVRRLVREEQLAYAVWGGRGDFVAPSLFTVSVLLRPEASFEAVEAIVREELAAVGTATTADALDGVRTHMRNGFLSSLDNPEAVFDALGWSIRRAGDAGGLDRFHARLVDVTPDDLASVVAQVFVDDRLTVATLAAAEGDE
jgi:zinc protease